MYKIERKDFGFKLTFGEFMNAEEMKNWVEDSKKSLSTAPKEFGVFVDMRTLKPLPQDSQKAMEEGQKLYKERGMSRSVVILNSPTVTAQFKRIAKETGIYNWERYLDASTIPNWEEKGRSWLSRAIDPDRPTVAQK